jgi:hypothetical protein
VSEVLLLLQLVPDANMVAIIITILTIEKYFIFISFMKLKLPPVKIKKEFILMEAFF